MFKTPTLLNAAFNAPYFHDGRFNTYGEVIDHFDRVFDLGLTPQDHADLEAYLSAIGDGVRPEYHLTGSNVLADIVDFSSVLDFAIAGHDREVVALTVRSVSDLLQDLLDQYPDPGGSGPAGGADERRVVRAVITALMQSLHRTGLDVAAARFSQAGGEYSNFRKLAFAAAPSALQAAERWSLFNPTLHDAHRAALRRAHGERGSIAAAH
jgi:hypothetical protein